jgi:hypothetical protein
MLKLLVYNGKYRILFLYNTFSSHVRFASASQTVKTVNTTCRAIYKNLIPPYTLSTRCGEISGSHGGRFLPEYTMQHPRRQSSSYLHFTLTVLQFYSYKLTNGLLPSGCPNLVYFYYKLTYLHENVAEENVAS